MTLTLDDIIIKRKQDEQLSATKEHKLAMTLHSARSAVATLFEMSNDADYRDLMVEEAGDISSIALAVSLIWSRVQARSAA